LSGRSANYTYDALYRLTAETIAGGAPNNGTISYAYDAVGNRLTRTSTSAGVPSATSTYDVDDRLTSDTYDANGNTVTSGGNTYAYDFEDHMKTATGGVSYVYDGDGRRVRKTTGGGTTNYLIDDRNPSGLPQVLEEISGGTVQRVYVYGLARISERQGGATSFYGYDGRGSVRLLTNAAGAVTDTYNYDAFGIKLDSAGATPNDFLFSGEQFDSNLQFYYMRARYLNQASGRFLTMDPMPGTTTDPRSLHRYLYAAGDPVNKTDPTGNQFDLVSISISISIDTSIQQIYTTQLVHTFFDVQQLAYCCLQPALVLKDVALELIIDDGPDWAWDLYEGASEAEAKAYQMIAMRLAQTYKNILHDIGHAEFEVTIPLVDKKFKYEIDLADITGVPDYSKKLEEAQSALDSFFGEWKGLLDGADSAGNCDVSKFINKWGTKLADKVIGKIFGGG
jgi:RHS repeat-associated protein